MWLKFNCVAILSSLPPRGKERTASIQDNHNSGWSPYKQPPEVWFVSSVITNWPEGFWRLRALSLTQSRPGCLHCYSQTYIPCSSELSPTLTENSVSWAVKPQPTRIFLIICQNKANQPSGFFAGINLVLLDHWMCHSFSTKLFLRG